MEKARDIFDELQDKGTIDYFVTFDMEGGGMLGKDRFGNLPVVADATSPEGKKLIIEAMQKTKEAFIKNIDRIRIALQLHNNQHLYRSDSWTEEYGNFRFNCRHISGSGIADNYLFDQDGEPIVTPSHLDRVLNKWDDKELKLLTIYIIPADVHY
jgi:hypothetical protein